MFDVRPPLHIVGLVLVVTGLMMLPPAAVDLWARVPDWSAHVESALFTVFCGTVTALACRTDGRMPGLDIRQAFLMTAVLWVVVPMFGTLPMMLGAPYLSFTDAYFEAVSGITTTGSTVIDRLETLPPGTNLWRGLLNWMGGLGFSFVAMVFLPFLRVGGMQFFQVQGFDTMGKVLPRAHDIAGALLKFYVGLTLVVFVTYFAYGMSALDAAVHAFATVSCGGFSTDDLSFGKYTGGVEYFGGIYMIVASLPFIRFIQLIQGAPRPILSDWQVRTYLVLIALTVAATVVWRLATSDESFEPVLRTSFFNMVSIFSGTGFGTADVASWGAFVVGLAFVVGMIGGCTSSTSAAISVFRWQIAVLAIRQQILKLHAPSRIAKLRYEGREVEDDVLNPTIAFFTAFILCFGLMTAMVTFSGVELMSATFAVWTSIGNIGYGFGDIVSRTGTMIDVPTESKWVLIAAMLLGRVGMMPLIVLLLPRFWRG